MSASGIAAFEATIEATVNPENEAATCRVEYGETTTYGTEAPCEQASLNGHGGQPASARLNNLKAGTTYHYRVVAENTALASKPTEGTGEFTTAPALEAVIEAESVSVESEASSGHREVTFTATGRSRVAADHVVRVRIRRDRRALRSERAVRTVLAADRRWEHGRAGQREGRRPRGGRRLPLPSRGRQQDWHGRRDRPGVRAARRGDGRAALRSAGPRAGHDRDGRRRSQP